MFDKFLKRVEKISESEDKSIMKKDEGVTNNKNFTPSSTTINSLNPDFVGFKPFDPEFKYNKGFNANGKSFGKKGMNGKKFNSYTKSFDDSKIFKKEYVDDGSYFCSYATGGNTVVCYKNNQKMEFLLWEIEHPDKNHFLAKRANYFLNNLVKKKKIIIKEKENNLVEIFLIDNPNLSINSLMIAEGFHSSVPYNEKTNKVNPFDKYKNKTKNDDENDENENSSKEDSKKINESLKKEKKNFAYGLFAKSSDTFEALFNNKKITCKLHNLDISIYDDSIQKKIKNIIYEFVSKKSIILDFKNEEKDPFIVTVSNKDGEVLNDIILAKNFSKKVLDSNNSVQNNDSNLKSDDNCVESDWDWVEQDDSPESNSKIEHPNDLNEIDIPETSVIPKMFQNKSKSNSLFSRIKKSESNENIITQLTDINSSDINIVDNDLIESNENSKNLNEIDIPEISVIPKMFQNKSRTNSPFSRIKKGESNENIITQPTETNDSNNLQVQTQKNKLSFGKR